jgi:hypothetical protein
MNCGEKDRETCASIKSEKNDNESERQKRREGEKERGQRARQPLAKRDIRGTDRRELAEPNREYTSPSLFGFRNVVDTWSGGATSLVVPMSRSPWIALVVGWRRPAGVEWRPASGSEWGPGAGTSLRVYVLASRVLGAKAYALPSVSNSCMFWGGLGRPKRVYTLV